MLGFMSRRISSDCVVREHNDRQSITDRRSLDSVHCGYVKIVLRADSNLIETVDLRYAV